MLEQDYNMPPPRCRQIPWSKSPKKRIESIKTFLLPQRFIMVFTEHTESQSEDQRPINSWNDLLDENLQGDIRENKLEESFTSNNGNVPPQKHTRIWFAKLDSMSFSICNCYERHISDVFNCYIYLGKRVNHKVVWPIIANDIKLQSILCSYGVNILNEDISKLDTDSCIRDDENVTYTHSIENSQQNLLISLSYRRNVPLPLGQENTASYILRKFPIYSGMKLSTISCFKLMDASVLPIMDIINLTSVKLKHCSELNLSFVNYNCTIEYPHANGFKKLACHRELLAHYSGYISGLIPYHSKSDSAVEANLHIVLKTKEEGEAFEILHNFIYGKSISYIINSREHELLNHVARYYSVPLLAKEIAIADCKQFQFPIYFLEKACDESLWPEVRKIYAKHCAKEFCKYRNNYSPNLIWLLILFRSLGSNNNNNNCLDYEDTTCVDSKNTLQEISWPIPFKTFKIIGDAIVDSCLEISDEFSNISKKFFETQGSIIIHKGGSCGVGYYDEPSYPVYAINASNNNSAFPQSGQLLGENHINPVYPMTMIYLFMAWSMKQFSSYLNLKNDTSANLDLTGLNDGKSEETGTTENAKPGDNLLKFLNWFNQALTKTRDIWKWCPTELFLKVLESTFTDNPLFGKNYFALLSQFPQVNKLLNTLAMRV